MALEMQIRGLMIDPVTNMPIIVLRDPRSEMVLPIWVGVFEANAIATQLEKIVSPRPMTHDLLCNTISSLGGRVDRVVITDLRENTFYATIHVDRNGDRLQIDSRPSDAMAIALRVGAPIFVEEAVIERSRAGRDSADPDPSEQLRRWLEQVDPEDLGKYPM